MAELKDYKCPACSGSLEFDPATQKMVCPFCGSTFEMAQLQDTPQNDGEWKTESAEDWGEDDNVSVFH